MASTLGSSTACLTNRSTLEEMRCKRMAKRVARDRLDDACTRCRALHQPAQRIRMDVVTPDDASVRVG